MYTMDVSIAVESIYVTVDGVISARRVVLLPYSIGVWVWFNGVS